ncbi:unnamed protein product [Caenorhabditis brenneri]
MLNEDCKKEIIKFLDYKSKCKLSFCSKTDYEIVSKVRDRVHRIEISENTDKYYYQKNRIYENVLVNIQFDSDKDSQNYIELVFSQLEEDTEVQWVKYDENEYPINRNTLITSSDFYQEAAKFFEKWMKKCNCEINEIRVKMKHYPIESSQIKQLPNCKTVDFQLDDVDHFRWWISKLPEELSVIHLAGIKNEQLVYPQDILSSPQVMNSKFFFFWGPAVFTDEQFLRLKANHLSFDSVNVTDDGINQYLKNWMNGKGVEGLKQVRVFKIHSELRILRGIDVWKWTQGFEYD